MSKLFLFLILVEYMVCHVSLYAGAKLNTYYLDSALLVSPETLHSQASRFALSIVLSMTSVGLYQRGQIMGPSMLLKMAVAFLFASLLLVITFFIFPAAYFGREILAWAMASSFIGLTAFRNLFFHIAGAQAQRRRVLVVGTGKNAGLISDLEHQSETFQVISYMYVKDKELIIPFKSHMPEDWILTDYIFDREIDEIVIAVDDRRKKLPLKEILDCKMMGVEVLDMLGFQEKELFKISIDHLHPSWIFFSTGFRINFLSRMTKRLFDIFVSLLLLVVMFPLMFLVA
ncbi:MAG: glycosyl transferase, partial [Gammaproteobacteria bacterium]|nr:glycosyl transferase [Gammaproteobacteria bacterium]